MNELINEQTRFSRVSAIQAWAFSPGKLILIGSSQISKAWDREIFESTQ